jgi:hypothetical protein
MLHLRDDLLRQDVEESYTDVFTRVEELMPWQACTPDLQ